MTKNGRLQLKSQCSVCGNKKSRFVKEQEGKGILSSLGKNTDDINSKIIKSNGRPQLKPHYSICGNKKSRFISQGSGLFDILGLNTPLNRLKKLYGIDLNYKT